MDFSRKLMKKMTWGRPVNVINAIMKALINSETLSPEHAGMEETKLFCELARAENKRRKTEGESSW